MLELRILDSHLIQAMDTMRRHELAEAIRSERLARQSGRLNPVCRFLIRVGDLLIAVGERLRARYVPPVQPAPEVYCVEC
jgi:hypothetical protein